MSTPSAAPLHGLRVLDFSQNLPGPYASFLLASMGADVVKVEPPKGDPGRFAEPFFSMLNRGKRSVVLDLRDERSAVALQALVKWADVLIEGFRPGVMTRLGCDWEQASAWNPRLIYCSISAFGQQGPRAAQPAHDLNLQALTGACHLQRDADERPQGTALPVADLSTSMVAVASVCAAIAARGAEGKGTYLDVAMSDAVLSWVDLWGHGIDLAGDAARTVESRGGGLAERLAAPLVRRLERDKLFAMPHYGLYRTRDHRWLALGIVDEKHFWRSLCEVVGWGALAKLPLPARTAAGPVLRRLLARRLRRENQSDWLARFEAAGVPVTPVHDLEQVRTEPQFLARDLIDAAGQVRAPLPGAAHITAPSPRLGQHTEALLTELGVVAPAPATRG